jgi:hypothetical protein
MKLKQNNKEVTQPTRKINKWNQEAKQQTNKTIIKNNNKTNQNAKN